MTLSEQRRMSNPAKPHIYWGKYAQTWCVSGHYPSALFTKASMFCWNRKAPV